MVAAEENGSSLKCSGRMKRLTLPFIMSFETGDH